MDFHQVLAVLDELARDGAVDEDRVAIGIVAADLALALAQEAVVAHPVGHVVGQPRAALRTVVVGAGRADLERELLVPVHALGAVRHAEAVADAEPGCGLHLVGRSLLARM
jgi:hypothetical protein